MDDLATGHGVKAAAEAALAPSRAQAGGRHGRDRRLRQGGRGNGARLRSGGSAGGSRSARCTGSSPTRQASMSRSCSSCAGASATASSSTLPASRGPARSSSSSRPMCSSPAPAPTRSRLRWRNAMRCCGCLAGRQHPLRRRGRRGCCTRRGIVAIPDFISNSGGVHLYESVEQDDEPEGGAREDRSSSSPAQCSGHSRPLTRRAITPLAAALREVRALSGCRDGSRGRRSRRARRRLAGDLVQHLLPAREQALQLLARRAVRRDCVGVCPVLRELPLEARDERLLLLDFALEELERRR